MSETELLELEARLFTRYLLRCEPGADLVDRYVAANRALLDDDDRPADHAALDLCRRHPVLLPLLDAAAGIAGRGGSRLRHKLIIMTAILEATTDFAPRFMPRERTGPGDLVAVGVAGTFAAGKAALGLPLWWLLARRER